MSFARPFGSRVVRAQGAEAVGEEVRGGGVVAALPEPAGAVGGAEALGARCVCRCGCSSCPLGGCRTVALALALVLADGTWVSGPGGGRWLGAGCVVGVAVDLGEEVKGGWVDCDGRGGGRGHGFGRLGWAWPGGDGAEDWRFRVRGAACRDWGGGSCWRATLGTVERWVVRAALPYGSLGS